MDQPQNPEPQIVQANQESKKTSSLTRNILLTTLAIILVFFAEYFFFTQSLHNSQGSGLAGLGVFIFLAFQVIICVPGIIISIILLITTNAFLKKNPIISKIIAIFYLLAPLLTILIIFTHSHYYTPVAIVSLPLLLYDWIFVKIYLESRKSIKFTRLQITEKETDNASTGKVTKITSTKYLLFFRIFYFILAILILFISTKIIFFPVMFDPMHKPNSGDFILLLISIILTFYFALIGYKIKKNLKQSLFLIKMLIIGYVFINIALGVFLQGEALMLLFFTMVYPMPIMLLMIFSYFILFILTKLNKNNENSGNSGQISSQNQPAATQPPNSDPRFPTFDTQPKPNNANNKK